VLAAVRPGAFHAKHSSVQRATRWESTSNHRSIFSFG